MRKRIKELVAGHPYSQEYICLNENGIIPPAYLANNNIPVPHIFIGYKPVIIATNHSITKLEVRQDIKGNIKNIGKIKFSKLSQHFASRPDIHFHVGIRSNSYLIPAWKKVISRSIYNIRSNKKDPLYLTNDLYDQVRLLYSIPRKISLISTGENELYNVCPTDLHGEIDNNHYIISLRSNGKIRSQINSIKKILLADIDIEAYKEVYQLGKNHMKELNPVEQHAMLSSQYSKVFHFPIPKLCIEYKELELIEHINIGVHDVLLFKTIHQESLRKGNKLAHVHAYYAGWRKSQKMDDVYLLR